MRSFGKDYLVFFVFLDSFIHFICRGPAEADSWVARYAGVVRGLKWPGHG